MATPLSATGALPQEFVEQWLANVPRRVTQRIAQGYARGETVDQLTRAIRGTKAANYRDGLLEVSRREAEAVARTSVQHVASAGRQAVWEANRDVVAGYRFVATLDSRTTAVCRSLDGQVFEVGKGPVPPVHINCRSTTVAELDPKLGLGFLDTGATRSSKDGYVPAELSYYDWMSTQPAKFQDSVLGPTRGELFRKGGLSADEFASLQLDRNFKPTTLEEMRRREPLAFERAGL
jgi:SPP1 gp7 family putative phage head morphogenesis protein